MTAETTDYEVAITTTAGVVQINLVDVDPEQALDAAVRTYIRDYVRARYGVIDKPHLHAEGVQEAIGAMVGGRVYQRFYLEPGQIGLRNKLLLDFDAKTLRVKADGVFAQTG